MVKIAVLMSVYNGERYIREQIDSILKQTGNFNIDLWVRDDGSIDQTKVILKEYEEKKLLNWYSGENLGPAKSFIDLIKHCPGYDYYAFSDQDDVWDDNKIYVAIEHLKNAHTPVVYCSNAELVDTDLNLLHQKCNSYIPSYNFLGVLTGGGVQGATMMFDKSLAEAVIEKEIPSFVSMHDYYIATLCLALGGKIIYDPDCHMKYRQHESNLIGINKKKIATIQNRIRMIKNSDGFFDIERTSKQLLGTYRNSIHNNELLLLKKVSNYKRNFFTRISLAFGKGIGLGRFNISVARRLSIVFGKV